ncbi:response regulator [uncultured Aquimarina sp.]|uniref:response regulator n=1 Tax=uncultured Aquimarina sp. TaxID=575652 RepID=UPI00260AA847|nr:response regulator [uncultured Aquimarina sp.]
MKKLKFLLIDDSPSTNFFNKVIIEKTSMSEEIQIAKNGEEAMQILNSFYIPDLILLDLNMPIMNGWEFLDEFQKLKGHCKDAMIILMLGAALPEEKKDLIKTISNVKGTIGKMLTNNIVMDLVIKHQENPTIDKCEVY